MYVVICYFFFWGRYLYMSEKSGLVKKFCGHSIRKKVHLQNISKKPNTTKSK